METAIIFATTHGTTEKVAKMIQEQLGPEIYPALQPEEKRQTRPGPI
jgi:flavodoxin